MQRLLPPVLVLLLAAVAVVLGRWVPILGPAATPWRLLGLVPILGGVVLGFFGAGLFRRVGTNIKTFDEPGQMVIDGPFRVTRNPMYLGFVLLLIGVALLIGTLTAWVAPVGFFAAANLWYIPFEERRMDDLFGDAYARYRRDVGRWMSMPGRSS